MVETIRGAGQCDRVLSSRRIIFPQINEEPSGEKHLMVLNDKGRRAVKVLKQIIKHDVLRGAGYEHVGDNIYLVTQPKEGRLDSVSLEVDGTESRVFFVECSTEHVNHWGRCTADGFACGQLDMDVWQKILECSGANSITVSRSYHMDCEPDWCREDETQPVSEEQRVMLELGLPLTFGQNHDLSSEPDDAQVESCMVEKDYDKELAELSSSTEKLSVSESSIPDDTDSSDYLRSKMKTINATSGSLTKEEFDEFWLMHGERLVEESWRAKYGDYIAENTKPDLANCSDEGICHDDSAYGTSENHDDDENQSCGEMDPCANSESYDAAWSELWKEHAWEVYLKLMNRLLEPEVPMYTAGDVQDQSNISMKSEGDLDDSKVSENDEGFQRDDSEQGCSGKRVLSLNDFGLAADGDSCVIENRYIKNHKLKKIKRESHNHKKLPLSTSADALEDAPKDARLAKYWAQRYRLFRKFDEGIRLNDAAWFSVTPEKIAEHIAARISPRRLRKTNLVVAAFCGVGGDVIQLASRSHTVLAIDNHRETIELAKHNAGVYGVANKIDFIQADMNTFVPRFAPDAALFSPPWGGPEYKDREAFDLKDMEIDFVQIFQKWQEITPNIAAILPRNTKIDQLCELGRVEVEQNLLNKKIKTITAYYGDLICK